MSVLDNYGEFELPEEKSKIEVVEDPVKMVISSYEIFEKVATKIVNDKNIYLEPKAQLIYDEAVKLFNGKEQLKLTDKEAEKIVEFVKPKTFRLMDYFSIEGYFLSALHNTTTLDVLLIDKSNNFFSLGYKLKKNKTLIFGPNVNCYCLGESCQGDVINLGIVHHFAKKAIDGVQLNFWIGDEQALYAENGIQINLSKHDYLIGFQGHLTKGGIQINVGNIYNQGASIWNLEGGIQINLGKMAPYSNTMINLTDSFLSSKVKKLKKKLEKELEKVEIFENLFLGMSYERKVNMVRQFDWNSFEKNINAIAYALKNLDTEYLFDDETKDVGFLKSLFSRVNEYFSFK